MRRLVLVGFVAMFSAACATDPRDIGRDPIMTAVGTGLSFDDNLPIGPSRDGALGRQMRLDENRVNLFRDVRAMTIGDVVTINIYMDDKAILGNSTDRSRDSKVSSRWYFFFDFIPGLGSGQGSGMGAQGNLNNEIKASTSALGQGSINRSEQIRLSVAAVVTAVLPNGNLLLRGSQEIRVNQELRVLNIAGIARPRDISKDNTIGYEKIAEARVSYGGRGRLSEVQQPAWGHQLYDVFSPF